MTRGQRRAHRLVWGLLLPLLLALLAGSLLDRWSYPAQEAPAALREGGRP